MKIVSVCNSKSLFAKCHIIIWSWNREIFVCYHTRNVPHYCIRVNIYTHTIILQWYSGVNKYIDMIAIPSAIYYKLFGCTKSRKPNFHTTQLTYSIFTIVCWMRCICIWHTLGAGISNSQLRTHTHTHPENNPKNENKNALPPKANSTRHKTCYTHFWQQITITHTYIH